MHNTTCLLDAYRSRLVAICVGLGAAKEVQECAKSEPTLVRPQVQSTPQPQEANSRREQPQATSPAESQRATAGAPTPDRPLTADEEVKAKLEQARAAQDRRDAAVNEALDLLFDGFDTYPPALMLPATCTVEVWKKPKPARTSPVDGGQLPAEPARLMAKYHLNSLDEKRAALDVQPDLSGRFTMGLFVLKVPGSSVAVEGPDGKSKDLELTVGIVGRTSQTDATRKLAAFEYLYKSGHCKGRARAF